MTNIPGSTAIGDHGFLTVLYNAGIKMNYFNPDIHCGRGDD